MEWIENINEWDLVGMAPGLSLVQLNNSISIEDSILPYMVLGGPLPPRNSVQPDEDIAKKIEEAYKNDPRPSASYWKSVQQEINELVCGNTDKYKELRTKLNQAAKVGEKGLATLIAANVAVAMGVEAGVISGFIALCLFSIKSLGINAYCRSIGANVT